MNAKQFEKAIKARTRTVRLGLEPKINEALKRHPLMSPEYALAVNTTQNMIKEVMSVVMNEFMPQGQEYFGEIAVRSACYAITALHPNDQELIAMAVKETLLNKLGDMQSQGIGIEGNWE